MAEDKIKINTARLDQTRGALEEKIARIKNDIDKISESMDALNAMWEGEAHQAFAQSVAEDLRELDLIYDAVRNLAEYERDASVEYNRCEQKVADLIGQIRI